MEYNQLSLEQKFAFEKIRQGNNVFITGPGGTGKSRLIKYISNWADENKRQISICAMTGCAAILLDCNAKTIHSWSGIKLAKGPTEEIIQSLLKRKNAIKIWKKTSILVLDEVSMLSRRLFELLDNIGKRVRKNNLPFGGIQLIFSGDFYQLPPVPENEEEETQFCFESPYWEITFPKSNNIELKTIFRQTDPQYIQLLMEVRKGNISEENAKLLEILSNKVFNKEEHNGCPITKLYPVRNKVDAINRIMFEKLQETEYEYEFISKTDCVTYLDGTNNPISLQDLKNGKELDAKDIEMEIKSMISQTQISPTLSLKIGAAVMCTSNLNLSLGICNGSQGIIVDICASNHSDGGYDELPLVQFTNGVKMKIPIKYYHSQNYPTIAIGQIPLCLAWALTIHKIQGATLDMAEIDIGHSIFECGQTYVALSRIKTQKGLYLSSFNPSRIKANQKVIKYYESFPKISKTDMLVYINNYRNREKEEPPTIQNQLEPHTKKVFMNIGEKMHLYPNTQLDFESYAYNEDNPNPTQTCKIIKI
jgi:ATP-dependent DNA helicase PIF1